VFFGGADFDPPPPLGTVGRSRYVKLKTPEEAEAIVDELQAIDFHHRSDRFEVHGYDSVDSEGVDVSIVAVGDDECTITFDTVT
jgi:hypothetical protein